MVLTRWIRSQKLTYNAQSHRVFEENEYIQTRENAQRIFLFQPYDYNNFESFLLDYVNAINGIHLISEKNNKWTIPPNFLIILFVKNVHWYVFRV